MHKRFAMLLILRATVLLAMGALSLCWPQSTMAALLFVFAAYAIVDGAFAVAATVVGRHDAWTGVLRGALGLGCGVLILLRPDIGAVSLIIAIGAWAIAIGVLELVTVGRMRRALHDVGWLHLAGIFSIVFGALLIADPALGAMTLVWIFAAYALIAGATTLVIGVALLSRLQHRIPPTTGVPYRDDEITPHAPLLPRLPGELRPRL